MSFWWLALPAALVLAWLLGRQGRLKTVLGALIERRLGGYRQQPEDTTVAACPSLATGTARVAVIGGGLAGIGAASALGERGIEVTLFERNEYLGGKIGAWKVPVGDAEQTIEHGFHAFFRQYYNLNRFLDRLGLREGFREIEDYLILDADRLPLSFGDVETAPVLNILDLGRKGFYRWRDVVSKRTRSRLDEFLRFDMEATYEAFDDVSFGRFCDEAALPEELRVSFRTFENTWMSTALR